MSRLPNNSFKPTLLRCSLAVLRYATPPLATFATRLNSGVRLLMRVLLLLFCILAPLAVLAHEDTIFPISSTGKISSIPPRFGKFHLSTDPNNKFLLLVNGKKRPFPACAMKFVRTKYLKDVAASGSWYHDTGRLPPYLSLRFYDSADMSFQAPRTELLIDLETGKTIDVVRWNRNLLRQTIRKHVQDCRGNAA